MRPTWTQTLIAPLACVLAVTAAYAQNISPDELNRRMVERRAVEAVIWGMPIISLDAMRQAYFRDGKAKYGDIIWWVSGSTWQNQSLTPNTSLRDLYIFLNTKNDGPVVLDLPPAANGSSFFGTIGDGWQVPLTDVGFEGKGGKYVVLPPDYTGEVPVGYIPVRSKTYNTLTGIRSILASNSEEDERNGDMHRRTPAKAPATKTLWTYNLTVDGYIVPNSQSFVNPVFTADRNWLHLEARYNSENLYTGSLWAGYNFSVGKKLVLDLTPMIGGVFGKTTGIAPGLEVALTYKRIQWSLSNEYVFDTTHNSGNSYEASTQVTYSPVDWFRVGLTAERTLAFRTSLDVQRGFLLGVSHNKWEFTTYVYNPIFHNPSVVLEVGVNF